MTQFRLAILVLLQSTTASMGSEIVHGPWRMEIGQTDLVVLRYKGEMMVSRGGLRGYLPAWKGSRFSMAGAEISRIPDSVTWHREDPDNQAATLKAALGPTTCRYSLDTTVTAAGPTEFWVQIAPEAVRADEGRCVVWLNGKPQTLLLSEKFDRIRGIDELRFEREDRTVVVRCSRFELQDRRAGGSGLFLVKVIGSSGVQPRTTSDFIEIDVREADPSTHEGRRALLSQRPVSHTPLTLKNVGFESSSLEGWTRNPLAALDSKMKHGGSQSARLTVSGDVQQRGHVYLIQSVPVVEGRLYQANAWIRGQDVKAANVGQMWPVGATIILEFADQQGKWFAAGSYGPKQYGTFGWRRTSTSPVMAPKGAGFAIIYLALRGTGTAWFDEVSATEVKYPVVLLDPLKGQHVHDNTPKLTWHHTPKVLTRLELCPNLDFTEGEVIRLDDIEAPAAQIEKPIAPGRWYWQVSAPGAVSDTWHFEQTAGLDEDTSDPTIEETHEWLASRTAPLQIGYSDNTEVTKVTLILDGTDVSRQVKAGRREARCLPTAGWAEGLHVAEVRVQDRAGNRAKRKLFFTHSKRLPKTTWRQMGGVDTDGKRRFLLGMYGVRIQDMAEIAAGGFDFVHSYRWDGSGTNAQAIGYLDAAQKHRLQAFIGINRQRLMACDEQFVAARVGALMSHPALFAWYLFDEPDLEHQYVSPVWLGRYYRLIKALDPFHPVVVTCARDGAVAQYRDSLDVHWTQVYGRTAFVASRLEKHREAMHKHTPLAAILHCYDRAQSARTGDAGPAPAQFQPDGQQMRANAFMAIAHNSSCLIWWWWGYGGSRRYFTVANAPKAWTSLKRTVADIKSLHPVLTADGEIHTWVEKPTEGAEVHVWEKKLSRRTLLIAVNRDKVACKVGFKPRSVPEARRANVLFEGREIEVRDGKLTDTFEPLGVHVYDWTRGH